MRKLGIAIALQVAILSALAAWRWHVWSYGTDTGTFAQVVSDAFGGFRDGAEQGTHFRFHWAPLLATLWPLVVLTRSPLSLQIAQAALLAATAVPLFAIARSYVPDGRAANYAIVALVYPPLLGVAFTEFHEIAFYPALALGIFWAADRARWRWFAIFAILGGLVREEACIVLAIAGIAFAAIGIVRRGESGGAGLLAGRPIEPERLAIAGIALLAINAAALGCYFGIVIPRVGAWQPSRFYEYAFAVGPLAVVVALVVRPARIAALLTVGRLTYLLEAFVPLALVPLRSPWTLLGVPALALLLLSSDPIAWRMGSHYPALWCPWLLLGTVAALISFARPQRWYVATVSLCALFLVAFNPMHVGHYLRPVYPDVADASRALAAVPADAYVATHDEWYTHDALRHRNASPFLCPYDAYAVYADDFENAFVQREILPELRAEVADGRASIVATFGRVRVYERRTVPGARPGTCVTPGDTRYRSLRESLAG